MSLMYDKKLFSKKLKELRTSNWELYKKNQDKRINPYEKFACCQSHETIAEKLNVERRTYGKWEKGKTFPTIDKVADICNILDCNIDYLLGAEELVGLSPSIIASHYSKIDIDIINMAIENSNYQTFLNYFMHPNNCYALVNSTTLNAWKDFNINTESDNILEPLKSLITDIFHSYQAFTPSMQYDTDSFRTYITECLPAEKFTFTRKKQDDCICISSCLTKEKIQELNLSIDNPQSYQLLIDYLTDYCFHIVLEKEYSDIQKEKIGKLFVRMLEKYLNEY